MTLVRALGLILLLGAATAGALAVRLDAELQRRHRHPGIPDRDYRFVPLRWRRSLYTEGGAEHVDRIWTSLLWVYVLGLLGGLMVHFG